MDGIQARRESIISCVHWRLYGNVEESVALVTIWASVKDTAKVHMSTMRAELSKKGFLATQNLGELKPPVKLYILIP